MAYWEKLKDPRWQQKRLRILERDKFACRSCGDKSSTLNVHHGFYAKGRDPWDYPDGSLWTLCETCHSECQDALEQLHEGISRIEPWLLHSLGEIMFCEPAPLAEFPYLKNLSDDAESEGELIDSHSLLCVWFAEFSAKMGDELAGMLFRLRKRMGEIRSTETEVVP